MKTKNTFFFRMLLFTLLSTGFLKSYAIPGAGKAAAGPDLFRMLTNLYPNPTGAGMYVSMDMYVQNIGDEGASPFVTAYYLSTDTVLSLPGDTSTLEDVMLTQTYQGALMAGQTLHDTAVFYVPMNAQPGQYYIIAHTDYLNATAETNEENNFLKIPLTVLPANIDLQPFPNVIPARMASGQVSYIGWSEFNFGNSSAASYVGKFYLSENDVLDEATDLYLDSNYFWATYPGSNYVSKSLFIPSYLNGDYFLIYKADANNFIEETNEGNNLFVQAVKIEPLTMDLYIDSLSASGGSYLTTSNYYNYSFQEKNDGNGWTPFSITRLYVSTDAIYDPSDIVLGDYYSSGVPPLPDYTFGQIGSTLPYYLTYGSYYLIAQADYGNNVAEANENNNFFAIPIQVVAPSIDLTVSPASVTEGQQGGPVYVEHQAHNLGLTEAQGAIVQYYLSQDTSYDATDALVGNAYIYSIQGQSSAYVNTYLSMPSTVDSGDYYLVYLVDAYNNVSETNESNNSTYSAIKITIANRDLFVSDITLSDTTLVHGSNYLLHYTIQNEGTEPAYFHYTGIFLSKDSIISADDTNLGLLNEYSIPADSSLSAQAYLTIPSNALTGNYYLLVDADNYKMVAESNEHNNTFAKLVHIEGVVVDFSVSAIYGDTSVVTNSYLHTNYSVDNKGDIDNYGTSVAFYLSSDTTRDSGDIQIGTQYLYYLPAGGSTFMDSYLSTYYISPGDYYLLHVVDPDNYITEVNEQNNVSYRKLTILAPSIDLAITDVQVDSTFVQNQYVSSTMIVNNLGQTYSNYTYNRVFLSADSILDGTDQYLAYDYQPPLYGGSSYTDYLSYYLPYDAIGEYYLIYITDQENNNSETNEENNTFVKKISILGPSIDLHVSNLTVYSSPVNPNTYISLDYILANSGTSYAGYFENYLYLSSDTVLSSEDQVLTSYYEYGLYGNSQVYRNQGLYIPNVAPGNYYLLLKADANQYIMETNEDNNVTYAPIAILPKEIDLTIKNVLVPAELLQGRATYLSFEDYNLGTSISEYHSIGVYLSQDTTFSPDTDVYLNSFYGYPLYPGSYYTLGNSINVPATVATGTYYLLIVDDMFNENMETNEANNIAKVKVVISKPDVDFVVQSAKIDRSSIIAGEVIKLSNYIYNQGTTASLYGNTFYYMSTDQVLDATDTFMGYTSYDVINGQSSFYNSLQVNTNYGTPTGTYYILYVADGNNQEAETNETNNVVAKAIKITAASIDLTVKSTQLSKSSVTPGGSLNVKSTIQNLGNVDAYGNYLMYYLSTDAAYSYDDINVGALFLNGVGENSSATYSSSIQIPSTVAAGTYYVIVMADGTYWINESVETNNVASKVIKVTTTAALAKGAREMEDAGVLNADELEAVVAPNPTTSDFVVYVSGISETDNVALVLYDLVGNVVYTSNESSLTRSYTVPSQSLPAGVYILKVEINGVSKTIRVVKQ